MRNFKVTSGNVLDLETVLDIVSSAHYGHDTPSAVTDTAAVTTRLDSVIDLLGLIAIQNAKLAAKE